MKLRAFGTRLNEDRKIAEKLAERKFTRAAKKESVDEMHNKSAISDHVSQ